MHKTKVSYQPCAHTTKRSHNIQIDAHLLENGSRFTFLGSAITHDGSLETELQTKMCKVSVAFERFGEKSGTTIMWQLK